MKRKYRLGVGSETGSCSRLKNEILGCGHVIRGCVVRATGERKIVIESDGIKGAQGHWPHGLENP